MEGICGRDTWMIFLGRWDSPKGFGNGRDSWKGSADDIPGRRDLWKGFRNGRDLQKGFADDIPGQKGFTEGIWKRMGFVERICG